MKQILAIFAAVICISISAAVKPLAIWNGDFKQANLTRNNVTMYRTYMTTLNSFSLLQWKSGSRGFDIYMSDKSLPRALIVNIKDVAANASTTKTVFSFAGTSSQLATGGTLYYWLSLTNNTVIAFDKPKSYSRNFTQESTALSFDRTEMHSYGVYIREKDSDGGTSYAYLDGEMVAQSGLVNLGNANYATIGSRYGDTTATAINQNSFIGATVNYVAVFASDDAPSASDFATWSLKDLARAETATNTTTAASNGNSADSILKGGDGVGINLLTSGGKYRVTSATAAAHALFVQESATLVFEGDDANLTLEGPVYIATNRTLTLTAGSDFTGGSISASTFADLDQIVVSMGEYAVTTNTTASGITLSFGSAASQTDEEEPDISEPPTFDGSTVGFAFQTEAGKWYSAAASTEIGTAGALGNFSNSTTPFAATGSSATITAEFPEGVSVMYYKIIRADSEDEIKSYLENRTQQQD